VPDWASLPAAARRLFARMMEVFAGFLAHTDHQVGRLIEFLRQLGELDNTLIMVISDNGASAEGGPTGTTNEVQFYNAQEPLEESLELIDEIGGPRHFNHYIRPKFPQDYRDPPHVPASHVKHPVSNIRADDGARRRECSCHGGTVVFRVASPPAAGRPMLGRVSVPAPSARSRAAASPSHPVNG
jgi:arylsulfatase A-like enzyme